MKKLHFDVVHLDYLKTTHMEVVYLHAFEMLPLSTLQGGSGLEQEYFKMIKMFKMFKIFEDAHIDY